MAQRQKTLIPSKGGDTPSGQKTGTAAPQAVGLTIADMKELLQMEFDKQNKRFEEQIQELKQLMLEEDKKLRVEIFDVKKELKEELDEGKKNTEILEKRVDDLELQMLKQEENAVMLQFERMEYAIRIRGCPEEKGDLEDMVAEGLAEAMDWENADLCKEIERIYRVNSRIAKENNLPRDIVVYFRGKRLRNRLVQLGYEKKVYINGKEVIIFKEIPPNILRLRKDFAFLVDKLRRRQIQFRWNIPIGLSFMYNGRRYNIKTVEDAVYFCETVWDINGKVLKATTEGFLTRPKEPILKAQTSLSEILDSTEEEVGSIAEIKRITSYKSSSKKKRRRKNTGDRRIRSRGRSSGRF